MNSDNIGKVFLKMRKSKNGFQHVQITLFLCTYVFINIFLNQSFFLSKNVLKSSIL